MNEQETLKDKEIYDLKSKIKSHESTIKVLNMKIRELEEQLSYLKQVEIANSRLINETKIQSITIDKLNNLILVTDEENRKEQLEMERKLQNEIVYYKGLHETGISKINAAENIIKLNEIQQNKILEMEQELKDIAEKNNEKITQLIVSHENKFENWKKRTMDYIMNAKKTMAINNLENLELNTKMTVLYKNQILEELNTQCSLVLDLLIEKEANKKKIFELNQEILIHKNTEKLLREKNKEYIYIINNLKDDNNKDDSNLKNDKNLNKKYFNDIVSLEKEYKNLLKNHKELKEKFSTFRDKQITFQKKYYKIIKIYKEALDELDSNEDSTSDNQSKKNNKVFINLKEILNKKNYDSFSIDEKKQVLQLLIKHLLPLIQDNQSNDISQLRDTFYNRDIIMNSTHYSKLTKFTEYSSRNHTQKNFNCKTEENNFFSDKKNYKFKSIFDSGEELLKSFKKSFKGKVRTNNLIYNDKYKCIFNNKVKSLKVLGENNLYRNNKNSNKNRNNKELIKFMKINSAFSK